MRKDKSNTPQPDNTDERLKLEALVQQPMREWSGADVIRWIENSSSLPAEWMGLAKAYFADDETEGDELADMQAKRMHKIFKGLEDAARIEAVSCLLIVRDQALMVVHAEEEAPDELLCPITREIFVDPVICADGHTCEFFCDSDQFCVLLRTLVLIVGGALGHGLLKFPAVLAGMKGLRLPTGLVAA